MIGIRRPARLAPPAEALERRRPVWAAMSELFLDTQLAPADHVRIAATCASSGDIVEELDFIYWNEVAPVLYVNLATPAGEWSGFALEWLEQKILLHRHTRWRCWWAYLISAKLTRAEWSAVRKAIRSA